MMNSELHISEEDDDDVEEDVKHRRQPQLGIAQVVAKSWETCFTGFDDIVESNKNVRGQKRNIEDITTKGKRDKLFCEESTVNKLATIIRNCSSRKSDPKCHSYTSNKRQKSIQMQLQNIQSLFQPTKENAELTSDVSIVVEDFESDNDVPNSPGNASTKSSVKTFANGLRKSRNWTFPDLSNSFDFPETSDVLSNSSLSVKEQVCRPRIPKRKSRPSVCLAKELYINRVYESPTVSSMSSDSSELKKYSSPDQIVKESLSDASEDIEDDESVSQNSVNISSVDSHSQATNEAEDETLPSEQQGSEWLQKGDWRKDPKKKDGHSGYFETKEKKSQSFVPGGLAERAWALENREKTSRLVWAHKRPEKLKSSLHKSLTLQLQTFNFSEGIVTSMCKVLKRPAASPSSEMEDDVDFPPATYTTSTFLQSANETVDGCHAENEKGRCLLLLKLNVINSLQLRPGNVIRIYPPWQTLHVPSVSFQIILCAYFIQVLPGISNTSIVKSIGTVTEEVIFLNTSDKRSDSALVKESGIVQENVYSSAITTDAKMDETTAHCHKNQRIFPQIKDRMIPAEGLVKELKTSIYFKHDMPPQLPVEGEKLVKKKSACFSLIEAFSICGAEFSICARVQRIWCYSSERIQPKVVHGSATEPSNIRYSLLLQDTNFHFCELELVNYESDAKNPWFDVLDAGEGRCYKIDNVKVLQKLHYARYPLLFIYLENIHRRQKSCLEKSSPRQPVCYKVSVCCVKGSVTGIPGASYPPHVPPNVYCLENIFSENKIQSRCLSCYAKVICIIGDMIYITDPSLKRPGLLPYVRIIFCPSSVQPSSLVAGSVILVVEPVVQKGLLYVDKYSKVLVLSPMTKKLSMGRNYFLKKQKADFIEELLSLDPMSYSWSKLNSNSRVAELIIVEGNIEDVDKETAVSWMECSMCSKEDLYQDAQSQIYCEHCNSVVESPKLNMKMNVYLTVSHVPGAVVDVELTCSTTKQLLKVSENNQQPRCDVAEVLNQGLGPIICYVKSKKMQDGREKFELLEASPQ